MDELHFSGRRSEELITYVADRPGRDFRYAIDASKIERELGWRPAVLFEQEWYLNNRWWVERVNSGSHFGERLGVAAGSLTG